MSTLSLENVGPIERLDINLAPGVTVLQGSNGAGKTTALESARSILSGQRTNISARDNTPRGTIDGLGVRMTIARQTRRTGELEVLTLEDRLNIADLVDPGIASPDAADARRIKALVSLSGTTAAPELFHDLAGGPDAFAALVDADSLKTDDLVEMAGKIKRDLERAARQKASQAEHEEGAALGCQEAIEGLDLAAECDADKLQAALESALAHRNLIQGKIDASAESERAYQQASEAYTQWQAHQSPEMSVEALRAKLERSSTEAITAGEELAQATAALESAQRAFDDADRVHQEALRAEQSVAQSLQQAESAAKAAEGWQAAINAHDPIKARDAGAALPEAEEAVERARAAVEQGALIRRAKDRLAQAEAHRAKAAELRKESERLRDAGKATDEVLTESVRSDRLRIQAGRLVTDTPERGPTLFAELSPGQRWRIALEIAVERIGRGGVVVVPQEAWEGLDPANRAIVAAHAKELGVCLLTAEATEGELHAVRYEPQPVESAA